MQAPPVFSGGRSSAFLRIRHPSILYPELIKKHSIQRCIGNINCDKKRYISALSSLLKKYGWDKARFFIDQSRGGVTPRTPGADILSVCKLAGAGFGIPPGAGTDDPLADSFIWAKRIPPSLPPSLPPRGHF